MLNEKQQEAVNTVKGPVVIIAGPGTGKTKTLVERVVNILINEKVEPEKIILTTFTNKAARELEIRINERLEEEDISIDISEMYIGTMHSIWLRLIEENIKYSNFFDNFELMTSDYEQHFFIYSRLKEYKKIDGFKEFFSNLSYEGDWKISGYLRNKFNDLNENCIGIKEIRTQDRYILFLKEAYILYENQLFEANKLDFSYLQVEFFNMLLKNKDFLSEINKKIDYLMIDEYQDSNRIQEKILLLLSNMKKNICVVGDEDQSIYRFRGATAENIINFYKHFPNECRTIILDKNYRSVNDIVDFNNKWINYIDWKGHKFQKNISSMRTDSLLNQNVLHIEGNYLDENIRNTVTFIKKLKAEKKITDYNQIAVLFSSFKDLSAKKLEEALKKEGINVYSPRTKVFFEMHEIKVTLGLILACYKKNIDIDLERKAVSFYNMKSLSEDKGTKNYLLECLNLARIEAKKDGKLFEWIKKRIENIENFEFESFNQIFYELFQFSYYKEILDEENLENSRARHNLSVLSSIFKNYQRHIFYKKISPRTNFEAVKYFFNNYLAIVKKSRIEDISVEEDYPSDCIPFLTIHQSKGLEFPVVIVFSLFSSPKFDENKNNITSIERLVNSENNLTEIDKAYFDFYRMFYVAFSRAKNMLVLSSDTKTLSENFKPFFYSVPSVVSSFFDIEQVSLDNISNKAEKKILAFTTDIALYQFCSKKYEFIRENKFQNFEKSVFNNGIIVHKAIEHINKRLKQEKNFVFSSEYIEDLVEKIYKFRKMKIDENFHEIIHLISNYLEKEKTNFEHISKVEASEYRIDENFILYGQIDLILEKENSVDLIDFKTGAYQEDKSYSKIYEEQLSLYKMLIQKKYKDKGIKTFLYYLEEEDYKKEIFIKEDNLEKNYRTIEKIAENILNKNFSKREFSQNTCGNCEFKYYCYGENL